MNRNEKATRFVMRCEDHNYETAAKLEVVDNCGYTLIGLNDKNDARHLAKYGLNSIKELYGLYKADKARALAIIAEVYDEHYYNHEYNRLNSERLAIRLFDQGVLNGVGTAVKKFQIAINNMGVACAPDGRFGPLTLAAANECDSDRLLNEFKRIMDARYHKIAETPDENGEFPNAENLAGWLNRLRKDEYDI